MKYRKGMFVVVDSRNPHAVRPRTKRTRGPYAGIVHRVTRSRVYVLRYVGHGEIAASITRYERVSR